MDFIHMSLMIQRVQMTIYFVLVARAELKWFCSTVIGPLL